MTLQGGCRPWSGYRTRPMQAFAVSSVHAKCGRAEARRAPAPALAGVPLTRGAEDVVCQEIMGGRAAWRKIAINVRGDCVKAGIATAQRRLVVGWALLLGVFTCCVLQFISLRIAGCWPGARSITRLYHTHNWLLLHMGEGSGGGWLKLGAPGVSAHSTRGRAGGEGMGTARAADPPGRARAAPRRQGHRRDPVRQNNPTPPGEGAAAARRTVRRQSCR